MNFFEGSQRGRNAVKFSDGVRREKIEILGSYRHITSDCGGVIVGVELTPEEKVLHTARKHWLFLVYSLIELIVYIVVIYYINTRNLWLSEYHDIPVLFLVIIITLLAASILNQVLGTGYSLVLGFIGFIAAVILYLREKWYVTTHRVVGEYGILRKRIIECPHQAIQYIDHTKNLLRTITEYGNVTIMTAAQSGKIEAKFLDSPGRFVWHINKARSDLLKAHQLGKDMKEMVRRDKWVLIDDIEDAETVFWE